MPKASDVKKGMAVEADGKLLIVKDITVNNPSARGASTLYKMRFADVRSGQKVEQTYKGDELLPEVELDKRSISFSYKEGDTTIFMDNEDFSQYTFSNESIAEELLFIDEGTQGLVAVLIDGEVVNIELPQSVEMVIQDTAPSIKGASATARTKPAEFSTGLTIQVPEYIASGEKVKINTLEKRFMSRAE